MILNILSHMELNKNENLFLLIIILCIFKHFFKLLIFIIHNFKLIFYILTLIWSELLYYLLFSLIS